MVSHAPAPKHIMKNQPKFRVTPPPCCIQAEENILGGILLDPNALDRVKAQLKPKHFYIPNHEIIYRVMLELDESHQTTDLIVLETKLADLNLLEKIGGMMKLVQLLERTVSATNIDKFAQLTIDKYHRRQAIEAGQEITRLGEDPVASLERIYEQSSEIVRELFQDRQIEASAIAIEDALDGILDRQNRGHNTGLTAIDRLGGIRNSDLIIVGARLGIGKTWMGIYLSLQIAKKLPVLFFSAEMSREQLIKRFLANISGIENTRLINGEYNTTERKKLTAAIKTLSQLPIVIDDTSGSKLTVAKVESTLDRLIAERGQIGLVVIDYIQKLGDRTSSQRHQTIGQICGDLKDLAKTHNVPVLALSQLRRPNGSQEKPPTSTDLADSDDIGRDADLIMLLYQAPDSKSGEIDLIIDKNRNGESGTHQVGFDRATGNFTNLK
jgi:replicative DNA helicase